MLNRDALIEKVILHLGLRTPQIPSFGIDAEDALRNKYRIKYRTIPTADAPTAFGFDKRELHAPFHFLIGVLVKRNGAIEKIIRVKSDVLRDYVVHNKSRYNFRWYQDVPYPFEVVFPAVSSTTNAFLMTWNREKWNAWDFPQILADVNNGKSYSLRWRTANSHVKAGDRIFIMRLGKKEPRGIFASGVALGSPTFGKPVDDEFPHQRYVPIKITTLIDPAVRTLGWETLKAKVSASFKWTPEGSGIEIPPEVASKLDLLWERFTSSRPRPEIELGGVYSWKQIVEQFQANQTFLSQKDGKIVCATIDPDKNQLFPDALFVGTKERNIELANTLHGQIEPFPMFEKKGTNKWSFVGYFRFRQQVFDGHIFEEAKHLSPRPISSVVFLDPESDSHESAIDMYGEQVAIEGKKRLITHYRRERNRAIVKLKKEHVLRTTGKLQCEACDFDSKNFYGNHVPDFCDAHHNNPLAEARDDGTNTTLDDLSIICPNCHRAIHLLDPMPSVADFRRHKQ